MADMSLLVMAAGTSNPYWPNIVGNGVGALIGGLTAWAVAWWVAHREMEQAEKRQAQEQLERKEQERAERAEREARDESARAERHAQDEAERMERRAREEQERAERAAREEQERRDALHRSVMVSFLEACGKLQAALQEGRQATIRSKSLWAEGRAAQVRMLLHSEDRDDLLDWFNSRWQRNFTKLADLLTDAQIVGPSTELDGARARKVHDEFLLIENMCARWATQPISEWTSELPPTWLLTGVKPPSAEASEDRGE